MQKQEIKIIKVGFYTTGEVDTKEKEINEYLADGYEVFSTNSLDNGMVITLVRINE